MCTSVASVGFLRQTRVLSVMMSLTNNYEPLLKIHNTNLMINGVQTMGKVVRVQEVGHNASPTFGWLNIQFILIPNKLLISFCQKKITYLA